MTPDEEEIIRLATRLAPECSNFTVSVFLPPDEPDVVILLVQGKSDSGQTRKPDLEEPPPLLGQVLNASGGRLIAMARGASAEEAQRELRRKLEGKVLS